jgi:hypothetical protein
MAQPIVVAGATAESGAAVGPDQNHGARSYSRMAEDVKADAYNIRVICAKVGSIGPVLRLRGSK